MPGKVFPKTDDPVNVILEKRWPVRLRQRPESSLSPKELKLGFRLCDDALKKKWLSDIQRGYFYVEKIPPEEMIPATHKRPKKSSRKSKKPTSDPQNSASVNKNLDTQSQVTQDQSLSNQNGPSQTTPGQITQTQNQTASDLNSQSQGSPSGNRPNRYPVKRSSKRSKKSGKANKGGSSSGEYETQSDQTESASEDSPDKD